VSSRALAHLCDALLSPFRRTSTSPAKKFRASASVSADTPSTAVASLRALMADVEQLIDAGGRDA